VLGVEKKAYDSALHCNANHWSCHMVSSLRSVKTRRVPEPSRTLMLGPGDSAFKPPSEAFMVQRVNKT
ncbi:MAG: hypothetical protein ACE5PO_03365, partial [Candidatus Bathyarchaeia archaeon]